ncbi:cyclic nucleotide-binding domain-containing protein [Mycobacterium hodleri]|uniref:putative nucleotidyltransferase substrate binding domain-containing protein n=1 Tax=Mycolicibacterium hodleri TaxID=49897 RepID=UPI0021F25977|nr:putative nucleotidyltransferase substrate binding domain-containing protein [Mycolicibacterium hodleri]MCV7133419.1 cyclic nucleotide-binding domain-containing protein [Mycolicibacterium hodleri]
MKEFLDFLGAQSPYDRLDDHDLTRLAKAVEVEYFTAGTVIVEADAAPLDSLYVVRVGAVEIVDRGRVTDVLGAGETFGHISVLSGLPPPLQVRAAEDTLCYRLPDPRTLLQHPDRLRFSHYGGLVARERLISSGGSAARLERPIGEVAHPITWCDADDSIRTVAALMTDAGRSCALYIRAGQIGIVTDDDFRRRVATGEVGVDAPISAIASSPAIAMSVDRTVSTAYLFMVEQGIHHLVVVDAVGTAVGVVRVVDMAAAEVRNPLVIRSAAAAATTMDELVDASRLLTPTTVELWESGLPVEHIGALLSAMTESIYRKIIELHTTTSPLAELDCSWMLMGSLGRREPLPNSDVDTALAWAVKGPTDVEFTREYVAAATEPLITALTRCGLAPCPQGLNASSPLFNRSQRQWREIADVWRANPDKIDYLLMASTVLDARPITRPALIQPMRTALVGGIGRDAFTRALSRFSMSDRPPSGFVRGFVVEHFGEQRGHLNLKKSGLRPVASLARALAQRTGDPTGSTPQRLERAHRSGLLTADEADALSGAFSLFYHLVFDSQIAAIKTGAPVESAIDPATLDPLERRHLRSAFRTISGIQDRLSRKWFGYEGI